MTVYLYGHYLNLTKSDNFIQYAWKMTMGEFKHPLTETYKYWMGFPAFWKLMTLYSKQILYANNKSPSGIL